VDSLRAALPGLESVRIVERADDRHRYLTIGCRGGAEVPSWVSSGGALRFMASTLPAFLPDFTGVCLIEEPENGIHPRAVAAMFRCLAAASHAQILIATHSPVILGAASLEQVLCLAKTAEGATDIVRGSDHPALRNWQGELDLSTLFAAGGLG
jgi:predicted ATPase